MANLPPSITFWHRLEPRPRSNDLGNALAARVRVGNTYAGCGVPACDNAGIRIPQPEQTYTPVHTTTCPHLHLFLSCKAATTNVRHRLAATGHQMICSIHAVIYMIVIGALFPANHLVYNFLPIVPVWDVYCYIWTTMVSVISQYCQCEHSVTCQSLHLLARSPDTQHAAQAMPQRPQYAFV